MHAEVEPCGRSKVEATLKTKDMKTKEEEEKGSKMEATPEIERSRYEDEG
jgi:hypothetical protein